MSGAIMSVEADARALAVLLEDRLVTFNRISRSIWSEVWGETTRRPRMPERSVTGRKVKGTYSPPFMIAPTPAAICSGVTPMAWPNEAEAMVLASHRRGISGAVDSARPIWSRSSKPNSS